jgi:phage terminase large subunit GpA-like protein
MTAALKTIASVLVGIAPPPPVTPSEWAEAHIRLPDGPHAGERLDFSRTPYLREVTNMIADDSGVQQIVFRKSAQCGASTGVLAALMYRAACEPCRMALGLPNDGSAMDMNRSKLQPLIESSPTLRNLIEPQSSRTAMGSTVYSKAVPGGSLDLVNMNSAAELKSRTFQVIARDEASEVEAEIGGQGSPHDLLTARRESFLARGNWRDLAISTPTVQGACWISERYEESDQRRWFMPCDCGESFVFEFENLKFSRTYPYNAFYAKPCCGQILEYKDKQAVVARGEWRPTAPGARIRGYQISALESPFVPWNVVAERWWAAQGNQSALRYFLNTVLGRPFEIRGDAPRVERLMALREDYRQGLIPPQCIWVVMGCDVQMGGIYYEVLAIAPDRQSWVISAGTIDGDTTDPQRGAFAKLTELAERQWPDTHGGARRAVLVGIDSGFRTGVVYAWARGASNRFATKGVDGWSKPPINQGSLVDYDWAGQRIANGARVFSVGTWPLKGLFYDDLRKLRLSEGADFEPAGACHFGRFLDESYFKQLTSEHKTEEKYKGRTRTAWKQTAENHFLDCRIINLALAEHLGLSRLTASEEARWRERFNMPAAGTLRMLDYDDDDVDDNAPPPPLPPPHRRPDNFQVPQRMSRRSSFMD